MNANRHHANPKFSQVLLFSIATSVGLMVVKWYQWDLIDLLTPFLFFPLQLLVYGVWLGAVVWSVAEIFTQTERRQIQAFVALTIATVTAIAIIYVPFTQITLAIDFARHLDRRQEVVVSVDSGALKPNVSHNSSLIRLPEKYRDLSKGGGEIVVEHQGDTTMILFFTYRGILDNYSGFVYRSDNTEPPENAFFGNLKQSEKMKDRWFWVAST